MTAIAATQKELFLEWRRTGDYKVRNKLIESLLPIIRATAKRLYGDLTKDFVQRSVLHIIEQLHTYNPEKASIATWIVYLVKDVCRYERVFHTHMTHIPQGVIQHGCQNIYSYESLDDHIDAFVNETTPLDILTEERRIEEAERRLQSLTETQMKGIIKFYMDKDSIEDDREYKRLHGLVTSARQHLAKLQNDD